MNMHEELDNDLLETFQAELDEYLGILNKGLLALERNPTRDEREELLAELFRVAHSMKGASRAVGLQDISGIADRMEDLISAVQSGELTPTPDFFDAFFPAVDAVQEAMAAYLLGESNSGGRHDSLLTTLESVLKGDVPYASSPPSGHESESEPEPVTEIEPERVPDSELASVPASESRPSAAAAVIHAKPSDSSIRSPDTEATIRVATAKLDALMDSMGEILVTRMSSEQRLAELRVLDERLARWQRSWRQMRTYYSFLRRQNGQDPETAPLVDFLAANEENLNAVGEEIRSTTTSFAGDYSRLTILTDDLQDRVRTLRMLPVATLFDVFPRMVRDLAHERGKEIDLQIEGADCEVDRHVLEAMKDPLTHLLRNAVDHGIEPPEERIAAGKQRAGNIHLRAGQKGNTIVLEVSDDGAGINLEMIRRAAVDRRLVTEQESASISDQETIDLIFLSGFSTSSEVTDLSGRGVGLDVVRQNLEKLQGLIEVDSAPGLGSTFTLILPLTLTTNRVLLVAVGGQLVAVPTTSVQRILRVGITDMGSVEGRPAISDDGRILELISLGQALGMDLPEMPMEPEQMISVIILGAAEKRIAFRVDELRGTQEVVMKTIGRQLRRVRGVSGATILGSGQVVMILNVADLIKLPHVRPEAPAALQVKRKEIIRRRVLVVDDSITTRTMEKNILENAGYHVLVAADGEEAWGIVQSEELDAIVADIHMPHMDGFVLTEKVKGDERYRELPVVLVTALDSHQDKIRGLESGADAYITKQTFDQTHLLETIERLIA